MAGYGNGRGGVLGSIKAVSVAFLLVISVWFTFMGITASGDTTITASVGNHKLDSIYVSKRRVPNGPDPIHNRHFGKTRRPTGRT